MLNRHRWQAFAVKNRLICQRSKSRKTCWSFAVAVAPLMSLGSTGDSGDSTDSYMTLPKRRNFFNPQKKTRPMPTCQATKWMVDETSAATHGCSPQFPIRPTSRPRAPAMCSFDVCFFPAVRVKRCHPPGCQDLPPVVSRAYAGYRPKQEHLHPLPRLWSKTSNHPRNITTIDII